MARQDLTKKQFRITGHDKNIILYEGLFFTAKDCLESALNDQTNLNGADLVNMNLVNICLDSTALRNVKFDGSNLMGANLSETSFIDCTFRNTSLTGACFAFSQLTNCNFDGAIFGGTDIAGARLENLRFSTQSALKLNYIDAQYIKDCHFIQEHKIGFSSPPVTIQGLEKDIVVFDNHIKIGNYIKSAAEWIHEATQSMQTPHRNLDGGLYNFVCKNIDLVRTLSDKQISQTARHQENQISA